MSQAIVDEYFELWSQCKYDECDRLLSRNLRFEGPFDRFEDSASFVEAVKRLAPIVKEIRKRKEFVDGPDVCIIYDFVTNTPAGTVPIAEWFHVENGKISSIQAIFDARPFAAMMTGGH